MLKKIFLAFFRPSISFAVLLSVSIIAMSLTWNVANTRLIQKSLAERGVAPLGTEVTTDIMSLRVESVREDPVGALPFVPHEGNTFIIPTVVIENRSTTTRDLIPTLALYIKDSDGNLYNMAVAPLLTEQFGGPVLPHDKIRQEMAFEVKKSAKHLVFYFETAGRVMAENLEKE